MGFFTRLERNALWLLQNQSWSPSSVRNLVKMQCPSWMARRKLLFGDPTWSFFAKFCLHLRLLIQLVPRYGKPIFDSSPAPCATWPMLFGAIFVVPPPPHPTCSAVTLAISLGSPLLAQLSKLYFGVVFLHFRLLVQLVRRAHLTF